VSADVHPFLFGFIAIETVSGSHLQCGPLVGACALPSRLALSKLLAKFPSCCTTEDILVIAKIKTEALE